MLGVATRSSRFPIWNLLNPPSTAGARSCVERGATRVILLPYFLSPGKHVVEDLAAARDRLEGRFPGVCFAVAKPIGSHPLVLKVLEERAEEVEFPGS